MINEGLQEHKGDVRHEFPSLHAVPEIIEDPVEDIRPSEDNVARNLGERSVQGMKMTPLEIKPEKERLPESVLKILMDRKERGYRRGIDNDGHKVGLTFDAGAFAGVVSLAMAKGLQEAGLLEYVDAFYGLSAGGINAAYAAMEQIDEGIDTYVNLMVDNHLLQGPSLSQRRFLKMDLNVLRKAVYEQHPLKIKELIASRIPVVVGAHNLSRPGHPQTMFKSTEASPDNPNEFIEQMITGCNLPGIAGGPIKDSAGNAYTDATLAWSSSIELAIADGCTEVLSLANFAASPKELSTIKRMNSKTIGSAFGFAGNRYLKHNMPKEYRAEARRQKMLWKIAHPISTVLNSIMDETSSYFPNYSEVLGRKAKIERTGGGETLFVEKGYGGRPPVAVERIYPQELIEPGALELPGILTADKKRLRVGIQAAHIAVEEALKNATQVEAVAV